MKIILLKHGDKYNAEDVNRQAEKIREYCDHEILCLTEDPTGVIIGITPIPERPRLTKWWNKLHAFRSDFPIMDRCVLFDLDIDIIGNPFPTIEKINWDKPHFIHDHWKKDLDHRPHAYETEINSSIFAWTPHKNPEFWQIFACNIDYNTRKYKGIDRYIWDQKLNYGTFDDEIHTKIVL